jgi:bla regulator protein blaR1
LHEGGAFAVWLFMITSRWLFPIFTLAATCAQTPADHKEFDVVSVKLSAPDDHNSFMLRLLPGGKLNMVGMTLKRLVMEAYGVKAFQVSGGASWTGTERFDVLAEAEGTQGPFPMALMRPMLRRVLEDRFQLKAHQETREMPIYALVVEKGGSKLAPHTGTEQQFRDEYGSLNVKKGGTAALATWLSRELGRVVIDKTDLTGEYDYALEYTPEPGQGGPESIGQPPDPIPQPHPETSGPSIFTALQEQLGLRLASQRGRVEIVVIDSVQKPSAN